MPEDFLFTSESVSEGHPDKIADQISDAVLDALLVQDRQARVACETLVKTGLVLLAGEVTTTACVDFEKIVRKVVLDIGYDRDELGFNGNGCAVLHLMGKQSVEIAQGIHCDRLIGQGAGDQGLMFGFATQETDSMMPAALYYSHQLMQQQAFVRKSRILPWLRPDAKTQVTLRYHKGHPIEVDTIVFSTQHDPGVTQKLLQEAVMEEIIYPVLPKEWLSTTTRYFINPGGSFVLGGPISDCGLTGRKIIMDTYGGSAHHGGGAFSGKDPSKVDRSAAYMARYIAKNVVAAGLAKKCEVQLSYAIGMAMPTSIMVNTFGTGNIASKQIETLIKTHFDLTPYGMITHLNLLRPIYQQTVNYGHFGRTNDVFTWEKVDKVSQLLG